MIKFRNVTQKDFKKLYFWLNTPHVKQFWDQNENFSFQKISNKYSKKIIEGKVGIYIFSIDNIDIGFIQAYFLDDLASFMIQGTAKGIDLYIGDENYIYKGYGKDIIRQFIQNYIFCDSSVDYVVIDPEVKNTNAIKAYKKAGFEHANTAFNNYEKVTTYYMVMSRDKFFCNL
ncbi:MAG: GNAT family N-acetyltransferase [Candidatus Izimaplasma sp.]|nr:GNAT family N-acetyltransferase [Candidatus Izimaplasma bacterium]